jgi:hypothetical protein
MVYMFESRDTLLPVGLKYSHILEAFGLILGLHSEEPFLLPKQCRRGEREEDSPAGRTRPTDLGAGEPFEMGEQKAVNRNTTRRLIAPALPLHTFLYINKSIHCIEAAKYLLNCILLLDGFTSALWAYIPG